MIAKRPVAVVNQTFVRLSLEGGEPLGRLVQTLLAPAATFEIIGVVKDTVCFDSTRQAVPAIYVPFTFLGQSDWVVALTQMDPSSITRLVLNQVYALDKEQPVTQVRTLVGVLDDDVYAAPRFNLALFLVFGALGLILAVIGIYGVMSNTVAQQTHEIGVRMAIGATPSDVAGMVLRRGSWLLLAGLAVGLIGSLLATRLMSRMIWNVAAFDLLSFMVVSLILLFAGLSACAWPACRAARIHPLEALRYE